MVMSHLMTMDVDSVFQLWQDSDLTWDPAEYDGITTLRFPVDKIWKPDITLFSS
jgi:hypothetical protein